jgi:hypothetical protein
MAVKGYSALKENYWRFGKYKIQPISSEDMGDIRVWRNQQIKLLRQEEIISPADQDRYYRENIVKSFSDINPELVLFTFLVEEKRVGYGGLVHIDWPDKTAEVSFLMQPQFSEGREHDLWFQIFLEFLDYVCLPQLELDVITSEVYDIPERRSILSMLLDNGFVLNPEVRGLRDTVSEPGSFSLQKRLKPAVTRVVSFDD